MPESTTASVSPRQRRRRFQLVLVVLITVLAAALGLTVYGALTPISMDAPLPAAFSVSPTTAAGSATSVTVPQAARELGPARLLVPSLGIAAPLLSGSVVSSRDGRTLQIPNDPSKLTVYDGGAQPCDTRGTVLVAGHVTYGGVRGALWPLAGMQPAAMVYMTCADGTLTAWRAVSARRTDRSDLPQDIFASTGDLRAVLVTCGGTPTASGHYPDNVLVELVPVEISR